MDQTRSDIAHLYRRAGFGARPDELDVATSAGYEATVETLLSGLGSAPDPTGDRIAPPVFAPYQRPTAPAGTPQAIAGVKARAVAYRAELGQLQDWWLDRMIVTSTPLREKMTLVWHGHFATGVSKVKDPHLMYLQNQLFRTAGAGSFESLTQAVAKGGAMMAWLDTGTDKKSHPNENFARELMELFTLGLGQYSQTDVEEAARGFTGWVYDRTIDRWHLQGRQHDDGVKSFLGQRGDLSGEDVISIIVRQPASARFVAAKLWSQLAYPVEPTDAAITDLVGAYGSNFDLTALLRAIFRHPAFRSPAARTGLVKQPIEYLAGAARALRLDARVERLDAATGLPGVPPAGEKRHATLAELATTMAQTPFNPPNVGGWPQNSYWLNTATALGRLDAATALARRADLTAIEPLPTSGRATAVAALLGVDGWGPTTSAALSHVASDPPSLVALALTAPEYVLD